MIDCFCFITFYILKSEFIALNHSIQQIVHKSKQNLDIHNFGVSKEEHTIGHDFQFSDIMNDTANIENTLFKCMLRLDSEGLHMDEITKIARYKDGINVRKIRTKTDK